MSSAAPQTDRWTPVRAEVRAMWQLAWPVIVTQIGVITMGLVDAAMVGDLGADALAAVSIGGSLWFTCGSLLLGTVMALDPLISQAWGAGERAEAGAWFWQGIWLALGLGGALSLAMLHTEPIFALLGQAPEVGRLADVYVGARAWAMAPFLVFAVGRSMLNGVGDTRPVMVIAVVANLVNWAADAALIHGRFGMPALGVEGAGYATTATQMAMCVALFGVLRAPRYREADLRPQLPTRAAQWTILRLGLPIGGHLVAEFGVFAAAGVIAGQVSAVALAAHQIALGLASFNYMIPLGVSIAASVRVGQAIGAGRPDEAALAGRVALGLGAIAMAVMSVPFLLVPAFLAQWFTPDAEVLALAVELLAIAAAFQVFDGVQCVAGGCLRGAGDTRAAFVANLVAHWTMGLPLGWALAIPLGGGVHGVWWGLVASLGFAAVLLGLRFLRGRWRALGRVAA